MSLEPLQDVGDIRATLSLRDFMGASSVHFALDGRHLKDFDMPIEFVKVIEILKEHLGFHGTLVGDLLVPSLGRRLTALEPVYLPFIAGEAKDRGLLTTYVPCPWSDQRELKRLFSIPVSKKFSGGREQNHSLRGFPHNEDPDNTAEDHIAPADGLRKSQGCEGKEEGQSRARPKC